MKCFPSIVLLNFGAAARLFFYLPYARMTMPCSYRKWGNYLICLKKYKMRKMLRFVAKNVISIDNIHRRSINCELTIHLLHPLKLYDGWCVNWQQSTLVSSSHTHNKSIEEEEREDVEKFARFFRTNSYKNMKYSRNSTEIPPKYTILSGIKMNVSGILKN